MYTMLLNINYIGILLASLFFQATSMFGQISESGQPRSFTSQEIDDELVFTYSILPPNVEVLIQEDNAQGPGVKYLRDAVVVPVNLDLENDGTWFLLEGGARVWRLRLRIPQAYSLEAFFDEFYMPPEAEFYVFNHDGTEVFGSYTERNNVQTGEFSTEMIQGEVINLEYYEPVGSEGLGQIQLLDLGYRYRDAIGLGSEGHGADDCQVNVQCVEGALWAEQSKAVLRIRTRINGQLFWNTGTLMNNTAQDCRPLVLTSLSSSNFQNDMTSDFEFGFYRFYFDYSASVCGSSSLVAGLKSMSGCTHVGDSNDGGGMSGSDFLMLELNNSIPQEYQPYYAGWNSTGILQSESGVSISHPMGDLKKIATYNQLPTTSGWGVPDTHWRVFWELTESGSGFMEPGSLGAALFDSQGSVIGTFTGGASSCVDPESGEPEFPDSFGKMSSHWSDNPNPFSEKLRYILDPSGENVLLYTGSSAPCATGLAETDEANLRLYPNPANDFVRIQVGTSGFEGLMQVADVKGRIIISDEISFVESMDLNVSKLQPGVYFLTLISHSGGYFSGYIHVL